MAEHLEGILPIAIVLGASTGKVKYVSPAAEIVLGRALREQNLGSTHAAQCLSYDAPSLDLALSERLDFLAGLLAPEMAEMLLNGIREQLANGALLPDAWGLIMLPNPVARPTHNEQPSGGDNTCFDWQVLASAANTSASVHEHAPPENGPSSAMPPVAKQQLQLLGEQLLPVHSLQRQHQQQQQQPNVSRQEAPRPQPLSAPQLPSQQRQLQQVSHQHPPHSLQTPGYPERSSNDGDVGSGPVAAAPQRQDTDRSQPRLLRPPRALASGVGGGSFQPLHAGGEGDRGQQPYYLTDLTQLQTQTYRRVDARGQPSLAAALQTNDSNARQILLDSAESLQHFNGRLPRAGIGGGRGGQHHGALLGGDGGADGGGGGGNGHRWRPLRRGAPIDESGPTAPEHRSLLDDSARPQNAGNGDGAAAAARTAIAAEGQAAGDSAAERAPATPANDGGDTAAAPVGAVLRPFPQIPTQLSPPGRVEPIVEVDESRLLSRASEDQQQREQLPSGELPPQPPPPPLLLPHRAGAYAAAGAAAGAAAALAAEGSTTTGMVDPETSPFTYASVEASQHEDQRRQQHDRLDPGRPEQAYAAMLALPLHEEGHRPSAAAPPAPPPTQMQQPQYRRGSSSGGSGGGGGGGGGAAWPGGADARAPGPSNRLRRMSTRSRLDTLLQAYDADHEAKGRQGRRRRGGGSGGTGGGSPCTGSPAQTDSGTGPGRLGVTGPGGAAPAHDTAGSGSSGAEEARRTLRAMESGRRGGDNDDSGCSGEVGEGEEDEEETAEEAEEEASEGQEEEGEESDEVHWEELEGRWYHVRLRLFMPAVAAAAAAAGPSSAPQPQPAVQEPLLRLMLTDVDELVRTTGAVEAELVGLQARYSRLEMLLAHEHKLLEAVFPRQAIEHMTRVIAARSSTANRVTAPPPRAAAVAALEAVRFSVTGRLDLPQAGSSGGTAATAAHQHPVRGLRPPATSVPGSWPHPAAGLAAPPDGGDGGAAALLLPQGAAARSEPAEGPSNRQLRRLRHRSLLRTSTGRAQPPAAAAAAASGSGAAAVAPSAAASSTAAATLPPSSSPLCGLDAAAPLATAHRCVTVVFADIVGFTSMCNCLQPLEVMSFLNGLFTRFDTLCDIYGVYKVETIGDCFMAVGGLITVDGEGFQAVRSDGSEDELHALKVMSFAKAMVREVAQLVMPHNGAPLQLRVGLHSGPVTAGIVGAKMPRFCLFGDTVNTASRMESTCEAGAIHASGATRELLPGESWVATGGVQVKGKGEMQTYLWRPPRGFASAKASFSASVSTLGNSGGGAGAGPSGAAGSGASAIGSTWSPAATTGISTKRAAVSDGEIVRQQLMLLRQMTQAGGAPGPAAVQQRAGGSGAGAAAAAAAATPAASASRLANASLERSGGAPGLS